MAKRNVIILGWLLFFNIPVYSQVVSYKILPESKIIVTGTSTLHDWTINVNKFTGNLTMPKSLAQRAVPKKGDSFESVELTMEVKSMESGRGAAMDNRTFDALKAETNPNIIFTLKKSEVTEIKNTNDGTFILHAQGDLKIAGVTQPIDMTVEGQKLKDGKFVFSGSKSLKMTEFEVKPPSAMFGQIVAGDEVTIQFDKLTFSAN